MKHSMTTWSRAGILAAVVLFVVALANAQNPPAPNPGAQNPPPANSDKDKTPPPGNAITLDDPNAAPPVSAEEDAAFKAVNDTPQTDTAKRIELGQAFVQKYPNSRYRSNVYAILTMAYLQTGKVHEMEEVGEKELALNPNDAQILAIMGQTIPRAMNAQTPEPEKQLAKAEQYSRKALELTPTLPKPANVTDDVFSQAKAQMLAMAHGGLGLVYVRRGQFKEAIPELNQSVTIDPNPDPVNYYLLGLSNAKASHFDDAATAYNKCAAIAGAMQESCKKGAEEAKKAANTQLSAPK